MAKCCIDSCIFIKNIPLFPFPKDEEKLKEWEKKVFPISSSGATKSQEGDRICIRHFEKKYHTNKNQLLPNAIPTLELSSSRGNTVDDFEEMLSAQKAPPIKKKRGSSGLRNLQIARDKRNMRKERMKRIAEMRRLQKLQSASNSNDENQNKPKKTTVYDVSKDYFLGEREETENEKVLISLRLSKYLQDGKTMLKHPSSIRNAQTFPLFNSIKHMDSLVNMNPVFWDESMTLSLINHLLPLKENFIKRFKLHHVTGETILNLTKNDLITFIQLDESSASFLCDKFDQLRKETIMRYVNI